MPEILTENWLPLAIAVVGVVGYFFPSMKPILNKFVKALKTKDDPSTDVDEQLIAILILGQDLYHKLLENGDEEGAQQAVDLQTRAMDAVRKNAKESSA